MLPFLTKIINFFMRKFALLVVTLVVTITSNSGIVYVPGNASDAAKASIMAAPATTAVASKQKVSKGKLFMKVFKNKLEKIGKAGKRAGDKSKVVAAVLAFFLGGFGVHDFYLGNKRNGFIKLGLTLIGIALYVAGIVAFAASEAAALPILAIIGYLIILGVGIWAFVDFIRILTGSYEPVDGSYTN